MKPLWRLFCYFKHRTDNLGRQQVPIIQMKHQKFFLVGLDVLRMDVNVLNMDVNESCEWLGHHPLGEWIVTDRDRFDRAMGHLIMQERS